MLKYAFVLIVFAAFAHPPAYCGGGASEGHCECTSERFDASLVQVLDDKKVVLKKFSLPSEVMHAALATWAGEQCYKLKHALDDLDLCEKDGLPKIFNLILGAR